MLCEYTFGTGSVALGAFVRGRATFALRGARRDALRGGRRGACATCPNVVAHGARLGFGVRGLPTLLRGRVLQRPSSGTARGLRQLGGAKTPRLFERTGSPVLEKMDLGELLQQTRAQCLVYFYDTLDTSPKPQSHSHTWKENSFKK